MRVQMEIHQIIPALSYGDAISNDAIAINNILKSRGFKSNIYAKWHDSRVSEYVKPLSSYRGNSSNILFYHFSLGAGEINEYVKKLSDAKILIYHNITPPEFFYPYDKSSAFNCARGLKEIKELVGHFQLALGVSEFNRHDLVRYNFENTDVLPIFFDSSKFNLEMKNNSSRPKNDDIVNLLFVGRIAPNKFQEDVIKIFFCYNQYINKKSRLYLVGNKQIELYVSRLKELVEKLGLTDLVIFTGMIKDEDLIQYYQNSDVFVCMSEHEGFCVPLLEAMYSRIPIIAYNSTGIAYTLGDSGILVNKKNYIEIAELINIVMEDVDLRDNIIRKQISQLEKFKYEVTAEKLFSIIEEFSLNFLKKPVVTYKLEESE
jgi:glycosyltransferase involved in cell wall biosynthesis